LKIQTDMCNLRSKLESAVSKLF